MMTITKTTLTKGGKGSGYVMFGNTGTEEKRKWFERWYPTEDKAMAFAVKKGWEYKLTADKYDRLELSLNR